MLIYFGVLLQLRSSIIFCPQINPSRKNTESGTTPARSTSLVKNLTDGRKFLWQELCFSAASHTSIVMVGLKTKLSILKINRDSFGIPVATDREKEEILLSRSSIYAKADSLENLAVLSP
jgi:hypothetical protein